MRKHLKGFSVICALVLVMTCLFVPVSVASAAYITDGTQIFTAGDVNNDGEINICDLVAANNGDGTAAADLDGTGDVGAYDYALIRAMILGIDNSQWTE